MTTFRPALRRLLPWALLLAVAAPAAAQPGGAIEHAVQAGDTLQALAAHYLGDGRLWPGLQQENRVADPRRLQPGSVLRIPLHLLPPGSAEVAFVHGDAHVQLPGGPPRAPQPGQALAEGARVQAGADSFITVRLADGTLVRVQADSQVQIEQLRRRGRAGDAQSVLQLERGSVEPSVPPQPPQGQRRFEIRTPTASTAVRGTRFVVALAPDGRTLAAVTEGSLDVAAHRAGAGARRLEQGHGLVVSAAGAVGAPTPLLPAPDLAELPATLEDADFLTLALPPVPGAVAYQVQVARDAQSAAVVRSATAAGPQVRLPAVADGEYYLTVRAIDAAGLPGQQAQHTIRVKAHPVAPLAQAPLDGATLARAQGTLRCTAVQGATRYRIQVAGGAGFAAPLLDETRAGECALPLPALPAGSYRWRAASVRALASGAPDQGPFSPAQPFAVAELPAAVGAQHITARDSGPSVRLSWPGTPGQRFRLQVASDARGFDQPLVDEELAEPAWTAPALAAGSYLVRIRTRDASGLESAFSTPRQIVLPPAVQSGGGLPVHSADGRPLSAP
ncbi:FecR family protein [Pulveribacter suum]|uniref:Iron dicitrate transport regulator FecR n=1 Tax=Pulveribacter suum TaxID=2116657 RepID=A0A2P1NJA8_9BURK|nr:FecR domain-containing protein [Pulveribacter suum]AVP57112.1 iron dicitrate transport regulator FecR [Pulveribacter suum]